MDVPVVVEPETVAVPAEMAAGRVDPVAERVAAVGASYLEPSRSLNA